MVYSVTSARVPSAASARFLAFSLELMDLSVSSVAPFLKCSRSARFAATAGSAALGAKRALPVSYTHLTLPTILLV